MAFAENLRKIRESRLLSQKELAEMADLSQSAISLFELGKKNPNKRTLRILASVLGVTTDRLSCDEEQEMDPTIFKEKNVEVTITEKR